MSYKYIIFNLKFLANSMCDTMDIEQQTTYDITKYHGIDYSKMELVDVPPRVKVTMMHADPKTKTNGPLIGPFIQNKIGECSKEWASLKVEKAKDDEDGRKMIVVCGPKDGFCVQFEPGKTVESESIGFFGGRSDSGTYCRPATDSDTLDITIPVGRQVTVRKDKALHGPYTGPTYYPRMNVKEMKIEVEDMWLGEGKADKRSSPTISGGYINRNPSGLQFFTAEHQAHYHHHKHLSQHRNKTVGAYNIRNENIDEE